jgi:polyisoprenoid-binding protein YceI
MQTAMWTAAFAAASLALACDNNPAEGKTVSKASAPVEVASRQLGSATAATKYVFSNAGSKVEFVGAKVTKKHEGALNVFSGAIELVDGDPTKSVITVEIATGSLTADDPKLTAHLKSPDLLDVEKFPKAMFTSTSVKSGGEGGATHTVTGNLTLHGVTKSVSFPASVKLSGDVVDANAELALNRKDFGIVYPGMPDDLIKDEVLLRLQLHGMKMPATQ